MYRFVLIGVLFSAIATNAYHPFVIKRPNNFDVAIEALRLVHQANWASVATVSSDPSNAGYPMVNLLSTADSKIGAHSSGEIYFYMMGMDTVARDVEKNNKISFMFTDAQDGKCNMVGNDPWSHECGRTLITGQVKRLQEGTDEYARGLEAFVSRHPTASNWPTISVTDHGFYLCKLQITDVMVFGQFGYKHVTPAEYAFVAQLLDVINA